MGRENIRPGDPRVMFGFPFGPQQETQTPPAREVAVNQINKDRDFSLGDLNPLIHPVDLGRPASVGAVEFVTRKNIDKYGGIQPESLESTMVQDLNTGAAELRFVARFQTTSLTKEQYALLENVVGQRYGFTIRTRKDKKGNDVPTESYPPVSSGEEWKAKTGGWYMGPDLRPTTSLHKGLYVFKDLGPVTKDNFFANEQTSTRYIVEIREDGMKQTDLVSFVTQVSSILGKSQMLDEGELMYKTYYDLLRLSLKKVNPESLYGLENALDSIYRGLITPLASPDLSKGIKQEPESVLQIGVPGTGKTLIVEELLQQDNDVFILPLDPIELQKELMLAKEKQTLLARFAEVSRITGKSIVLHVDDIENMVGENEHTHSTMLNLMAGVRESGFHLIAATNNPEKIDPALLQPQRFGILIHFPLQDEKARFEILNIHANEQSKNLSLPLFASEEIRNVILKTVARHTDSFTPRYLAEVVTVAKSNLVKRIAYEKQKRVGLTEADLEGYTFNVEDWQDALDEVTSRYDAQATKDRDEELKNFVVKNTTAKIGFSKTPETGNFAQEVYTMLDKKASGNDIGTAAHYTN